MYNKKKNAYPYAFLFPNESRNTSGYIDGPNPNFNY